MNLVGVIYVFFFITITHQISAAEWNDPVGGGDPREKYDTIDVSKELDDIEFLIEAEQTYIDGKHREWKSCLETNKPRTECNALYEAMLKPEKPLTRLKHYHALLEERPHHHKHCRAKRSKQECHLDKRDREHRISNMELELYPWKDIHEMCIEVLSKKKCYEILDEIQIPRYRHLMPESLVTIAKAHICIDSGRSEADCETEANEHFDKVVAPKIEL